MMDPKRGAMRATALLVAVALVFPATAIAAARPGGSGQSGGEPSDTGGVATQTRTSSEEAGAYGMSSSETQMTQNRLTEQRRLQLSQRIRDRLRERKMHFDRAARVLRERIEQVERFAARVEAAGGDVSRVTALLDQARELLRLAVEFERQATELFNSIPDSDDPRATFEAAVEKAIAAVKALREARLRVRQAIVLLIGVIDGLMDA